ncbi:PTS glucose transporter subunit IIA [Liquorilactobacillus vini]|uniref:PTS sugar transporter subunit IIA n=1 Tax=Liquorilactobacillus vini TaxID=238015 RepID=UPI000301AB2C|nr:PTS glucose transporter subunit IIA [Liquorilactobacillus vini]
MFGFLKKKQLQVDNTLVSPVTGEMTDITHSSDQLFAERKMGNGFVVFPETGKLVSPVAGKVIMVAETKHAIGLKMANGIEVLIHLGIDTVDLKGAPFDLKIKVGEILNVGERIGTIDLDQIKNAGLSDEVLVIFTDGTEHSSLELTSGRHQAGERLGEINFTAN